jgi:hypothetical protein
VPRSPDSLVSAEPGSRSCCGRSSRVHHTTAFELLPLYAPPRRLAFRTFACAAIVETTVFHLGGIGSARIGVSPEICSVVLPRWPGNFRISRLKAALQRHLESHSGIRIAGAISRPGRRCQPAAYRNGKGGSWRLLHGTYGRLSGS